MRNNRTRQLMASIMLWSKVVSVLSLFCVGCVNSYVVESRECRLPEALKKEIAGYQGFVNELIGQTTRGKYSGRFYDDLAAFVDKFGNRLAGTKNLENSIEYIATQSKAAGLKVSLEPVKVPHWERGNESAYMISPRVKELKMLGLGYSPATGPSGITADVVVVSTFDELEKRAKEVKGKIVLFNDSYKNYGTNVQYRMKGPARAGNLGAVAALVRSITPFSIYSPHTGTTWFGSNDKQIPAAAITLEDADMLGRMAKAGIKITVKLYMEAKSFPDATSHNIIADIPGYMENHYVTLSGHIDSWDVGQGALDDGVGAFLALHSLYLLKAVNAPKPKRTVRGIIWTAEELGLIGAYGYLEKHKNELKNWTAAIESDGGLYKPIGMGFHGTEEATCIMKEIASLFKGIDATKVIKSENVGSDISVFKPYNVPLGEPESDPNNYMWFHHTDGDSMRTQNSTDMDKNLAMIAGTTYILANLSVPLPREGQSVWEVMGLNGIKNGENEVY